MAIFSEKSRQQGHDPSLNPLFSATRSLNAREKKPCRRSPPPLPSQQRLQTLLLLNAQMTFLACGCTQQKPCESDLIALSGQSRLTGYLLVQYTCPQPNHWRSVLFPKWNEGTGVRVNWPWQREELLKKRAGLQFTGSQQLTLCNIPPDLLPLSVLFFLLPPLVLLLLLL